MFGPKPTYLSCIWMTAYSELLYFLVSPLPETAMAYTLPHGCLSFCEGKFLLNCFFLSARGLWGACFYFGVSTFCPRGGVRNGFSLIFYLGQGGGRYSIRFLSSIFREGQFLFPSFFLESTLGQIIGIYTINVMMDRIGCISNITGSDDTYIWQQR